MPVLCTSRGKKTTHCALVANPCLISPASLNADLEAVSIAQDGSFFRTLMESRQVKTLRVDRLAAAGLRFELSVRHIREHGGLCSLSVFCTAKSPQIQKTGNGSKWPRWGRVAIRSG